MAEKYDVVIIGGGPGGYNCAIRAGQLGLKTALIEKNPTLGGTCLNVGCIPSKALLHASELYAHAVSDFEALGIETGPVTLNLAKMMAQKQDAVSGLTNGVQFLMKKNKVDTFQGWGKITGTGSVEVINDEGTKPLATKHIVIATGSEPVSLPGIEIDEKRIVSSTGALSLPSVPKSLVLIGAGVIGLELGSVWARLGAKVTVIEFLDRILPGTDNEIARQSKRIFEKQGLTFQMKEKVTKVKTLKTKLKVHTEPASEKNTSGEAAIYDADIVLVAIGRRPYTQGLGLEEAGISQDARGFIETDHFKTSLANVWAIGDCIHGPMLAHKAEEDAVAVAELIAGKAGHVNYDMVPGVVYTAPEIAWVGKTEEQLKAENIPYKAAKFSFAANSRARANHQTDGLVKILAHKETDRVLGAHLIGPGAGEMLGEICVAMEFGAASEDIARTCHAHPTYSEAVRQAAMGIEGWTMQS